MILRFGRCGAYQQTLWQQFYSVIVIFVKGIPDNSRCLFVDWSSLNATLDLAAQLATVEAVAGKIAPASSYETLNRNVTAYNTVIRPRLRIS